MRIWGLGVVIIALIGVALIPGLGLASAGFGLQSSGQDLAAQVREAETAFAKTMADRDLDAFRSFLAEGAVFISGAKALRGRDAIVEGWKAYYEGTEAPFSWRPETVEVTGSGDLGLSTGPVFNPAGDRVGTYVSTWQRQRDGSWKVVLDGGCPPCPRCD